MKTPAIIGLLLAFLAVAVAIAVTIWVRLEDAAISTAGMVALGLGVVLTVALGGGLMFLVFYSSRKGYDDPDR